MKVLKVQLCTAVPPTRKVMDSVPVVPLARTVMLLLPTPTELEELEETLGDELLGVLMLEELELDDEGFGPLPVEHVGKTKLPLCVP